MTILYAFKKTNPRLTRSQTNVWQMHCKKSWYSWHAFLKPWHSKLTVDYWPSLNVCWPSFCSVFHTVGTSETTVGGLSVLNCHWAGDERDHFDWLCTKRKMKMMKASKYQRQTQKALLILHLHFIWALQYDLKIAFDHNNMTVWNEVKTNMIHIQNGKQLLHCLHLVVSSLNGEYRPLPPTGMERYALSHRCRTYMLVGCWR